MAMDDVVEDYFGESVRLGVGRFAWQQYFRALREVERFRELAFAFERRGTKADVAVIRQRRRIIVSKTTKLERMRVERGAAPAEEEFAQQKALELRSMLADLPEPAKWAPSYRHRNPTHGYKGGRPHKPVPITLKRRVTERALIQRINRKLPERQQLKIGRPSREHGDRRFYLVSRNKVVDGNIDIAALGRKLRALKPHEELVKSEREALRPKWSKGLPFSIT
jgi:hypothetical protein